MRINEVGGQGTPCLVERIEVTAANAGSRAAGLEVLTRMVADHERADTAAGRPHRPRRDILADRLYTSAVNRVDDWIWPVLALGFVSVHHLTEHQLGQARRPLLNAAIVVDGQPYSPRLPTHLRELTLRRRSLPRRSRSSSTRPRLRSARRARCTPSAAGTTTAPGTSAARR